MDLTVSVAYGELVDKLTILNIKKIKIKDPNKIKEVNTELEILEEKAKVLKNLNEKEFLNLFKELYEVNLKLWEVEDTIRIHESNNEFNEKFIELARSVYFLNDNRFDIKSNINKFFGSKINEVKQYTKYK
jgi:hypothetical protein|tara:strand:+ start:646 stop:1038 length:393 start_codon:yes stop_codon:yes gene_type:complete